MPFVRATDGVPLCYRSVGRGRPIVLVHAWTMNGRLFDANAAALAEDHQVITVDLRGHGRSGKEPVNLTMAQLGADLATVIEHLDLHTLCSVACRWA